MEPFARAKEEEHEEPGPWGRKDNERRQGHRRGSRKQSGGDGADVIFPTLTHEAFPTFFSPPVQVNWNARARQVSIVERHRSKNKRQADTNG